uniref:Calcineurin-like phosphoesterase domain-containing protein n=1 Tax=viral metagenome TaxID=1070528 RepID=A0A6C0D6P3_9ZZZZ
MRIQYASDLHLELYKETTFDETLEVKADYLVLCGDIANLEDMNLCSFLEYVSERWKQIFWIPGNSEIWKTYMHEAKALIKLREVCSSYRNIKVLYMDTYLLEENDEKLLIVGLPLWHKPRDGAMLHYERNIYIKPIPPPIDSETFKNAHKKNVIFLEKIIKNSNYPLLICSYYPPFTWLYEEDWIQELNSAVIDRELERLITYPIVSWISGHNHLPIEYSRRYYDTIGYQGSVLFVSNPRGKPHQNPYYRREAVLKLQPNLIMPTPEEEKKPFWAIARQ